MKRNTIFGDPIKFTEIPENVSNLLKSDVVEDVLIGIEIARKYYSPNEYLYFIENLWRSVFFKRDIERVVWTLFEDLYKKQNNGITR